MSFTHELNDLTDQLKMEIIADQNNVFILQNLVRTVNDRQQITIQCRERIQDLTKKITYLQALKVVKELPQGSLEDRYAQFCVLQACNNICPADLDESMVSSVLRSSVDEATAMVAHGLGQ